MKYYLDCEFDGFNGPLLSMALVSHTGKTFYAVMNATATDPWVLKNVVPIMLDVPLNAIDSLHIYCTPERLTVALDIFLQSDGWPTVVTDWPDDIKYFTEAMIIGPGAMIHIPGMKFELHRVDAYPTALPGAIQHNAWWDAMALRHLMLEGVR